MAAAGQPPSVPPRVTAQDVQIPDWYHQAAHGSQDIWRWFDDHLDAIERRRAWVTKEIARSADATVKTFKLVDDIRSGKKEGDCYIAMKEAESWQDTVSELRHEQEELDGFRSYLSQHKLYWHHGAKVGALPSLQPPPPANLSSSVTARESQAAYQRRMQNQWDWEQQENEKEIKAIKEQNHQKWVKQQEYEKQQAELKHQQTMQMWDRMRAETEQRQKNREQQNARTRAAAQQRLLPLPRQPIQHRVATPARQIQQLQSPIVGAHSASESDSSSSSEPASSSQPRALAFDPGQNPFEDSNNYLPADIAAPSGGGGSAKDHVENPARARDERLPGTNAKDADHDDTADVTTNTPSQSTRNSLPQFQQLGSHSSSLLESLGPGMHVPSTATRDTELLRRAATPQAQQPQQHQQEARHQSVPVHPRQSWGPMMALSRPR
jgi:hypothetical protein